MFYNNTTLFCKKHLQKPEESSTDATLPARAKQLRRRQFCQIKTMGSAGEHLAFAMISEASKLSIQTNALLA